MQVASWIALVVLLFAGCVDSSRPQQTKQKHPTVIDLQADHIKGVVKLEWKAVVSHGTECQLKVRRLRSDTTIEYYLDSIVQCSTSAGLYNMDTIWFVSFDSLRGIKYREIDFSFTYSIGLIGTNEWCATSKPITTSKRADEILSLIREYNCGYTDAKALKKSPRLRELVGKGYSIGTAEDIIAKKIWLGMTRNELIESQGWPTDINKSVGAYGVHEQFVYGQFPYSDYYIYVEDGIVTSYQL